MDGLCQSILVRHADTISVKNADIAQRKLVTIISAALTLSNQKGFQAMSLRDLSKASGLSMGGLYAYFDSKTTLLNMILSEVTETVQMVLGNPPKEVIEDPVENLKWFIQSHIHMTEAMLPWFTFSFLEAKNFPKKERRMAVDSEELTEGYLADIVDRSIAAGIFRPDVSPLLPALIKPLLQDWYVKRAKYRRRKVSVETYILTIQDFVFAASMNWKAQSDEKSSLGFPVARTKTKTKKKRKNI